VKVGDVVVWRSTIRLEESREVLNALPTVTEDRSGGLLVADLVENQIRRYTSSGHLLASFGEAGTGPGKFNYLSAAVTLASGSVFGLGTRGEFTEFSSRGAILRSGHTALERIYAAALLDDSTLVLAGWLRGSPDGPLVHLWDLRHDRFVRSLFMVPHHDRQFSAAYAFSGSVSLAVRGDTIAATFARTDTVYLFHRTGESVARIPVPFRHFRAMTVPLQVGATSETRLGWQQSFSTVSQVFWAPDLTFYVQYFDLEGLEPKWHLLHMTRAGRLLFDVVDGPRLLTVTANNTLIFRDDTGEEMNLLQVAQAVGGGLAQ
jgi:hypothetical protein